MNSLSCPAHTSQLLPISLSLTARNEKLVFVNKVCALLLESRFGPGFHVEVPAYPSRCIEPGAHALSAVIESDPIPTFLPELLRHPLVILYVHQVPGTQLRTDAARVPPDHPTRSAPDLGRGSPPRLAIVNTVQGPN